MSVPLHSIDDDQPIGPGRTLRALAQWPHESLVDFMVVSIPGRDALTLIVSTGRKAWRVLVNLPVESLHPNCRAISAKWLKANWDKWIYPECRSEDVTVGFYSVPGAVIDLDLKV